MIDGDYMSIENFFEQYNSASVVFDPVPSYRGDWVFTLENLFRNSKVENNIKLFQEFFDRTYANPMESIFKNSNILGFQVKMISKANPNNIGRCLRYSKVDFFISMNYFLNQNIDRCGKTNEEQNAYLSGLFSHIKEDNDSLNAVYAEALKLKLQKLKDLMENEIQSEYYDSALKDFQIYDGKISFKSFISGLYKITSDFYQGMLGLNDFFDTDIDFNDLYKCFDSDTFYLLFAKIIFEFNKEREEQTGYLDNSYGYLHYYNNAIKEVVKDQKRYNPKIFFTLANKKKIKYSRWDFQIEFNELMERHPEAGSFKLPTLSDDDAHKYKDISLMEKLSQLHQNDLQTNWEFLPEGEGIKKGVANYYPITNKNSSINKEKLISETNMRIDILMNSEKVGRPIKGLNTFNGYYAFVYANGVVILEKFWENEDTRNPAVHAATYVMNIDNFVEMSKMSRITLVEYIKTFPEIGVKRIFHTSINNWQRNLYNEINGSYRLEDAIAFINGLKSEGLTSNE